MWIFLICKFCCLHFCFHVQNRPPFIATRLSHHYFGFYWQNKMNKKNVNKSPFIQVLCVALFPEQYNCPKELCAPFTSLAVCCLSTIAIYLLLWNNRISGVMVSVLVWSAVDRGFKPRSGQTKHYKIGICCFSNKHAALRRKGKDWLVWNWNNVSEWSGRGRI